ncbi:cobalamin B12-binding domain-containing protein [Rhodohalobacter sulfatireducens]|nr:cobalamin-dependent protein [Rhodohalobacter sulfatireducens]
MTDQLNQKTGIEISEKSFDWEAHLNLYYQHFTQAIVNSNPQLFLEFLSWARSVQKSRNMSKKTFREILNRFDAELSNSLDIAAKEQAIEFLHTVMDEKPITNGEIESYIKRENEYGDLAVSYFDSLMDGDRKTASQLILDAVEEDGVSVKDIYMHVFQPSQYEVGRLWQINEISVAQEHFCTAATQLIMSQLYPHIFNTERVGKSIVATTIGGDLHEIGIRMVSDFFEMEGWDTFYLGANSPAADVMDEIIHREADILAVSVTMSNFLSNAKELIQSVRQNLECGDVKILIGGRPFKIYDSFWEKFGADGFAGNAHEAVEIANRLTSTK